MADAQGGTPSETDGGATTELQGGEATTGGSGSTPSDLGLAKFDPAQVYLVSRLVNSPYLVLSPASDVGQYVLGIDAMSIHCKMKLQGNELVYQPYFAPLRRFSLDVSGSPRRDDLRIAGDALDDNDPVVPSPGCGDAEVEEYHVDPQGGLIYTCLGKPYVWYSGADQVADDIFRIWALGNDGLGIIDIQGDPGVRVRALAGGDSYRVPELDSNSDFLSETAFRAHGDGFHVAAVRSVAGSDTAAELWGISSTGVVSVLGTYPALPTPGDAKYALDTNDVLYAYASVGQVGHQLVRLTLAGGVATIERPSGSDLLFEERSDEPALVTGP